MTEETEGKNGRDEGRIDKRTMDVWRKENMEREARVDGKKMGGEEGRDGWIERWEGMMGWMGKGDGAWLMMEQSPTVVRVNNPGHNSQCLDGFMD